MMHFFTAAPPGKVFSDLLGKTVVDVQIGNDPYADSSREWLKLTTNQGEVYVYYSEGDCCSHSWFNHLSGLEHLIGHRITAIQEKSLDDAGFEQDGDSIQLYGWTFTTTRGYVDLEMRNASNGYYGGYVSKVDLDKVTASEWRQVTVDF